jgi:hypothetical protein
MTAAEIGMQEYNIFFGIWKTTIRPPAFPARAKEQLKNTALKARADASMDGVAVHPLLDIRRCSYHRDHAYSDHRR